MAWQMLLRLAAGAGRLGRGVGNFVGRNATAENAGLLGSVKKLTDSLGTIQDQIVVTVTGGPRSDIKALFRLAASVAFGKVKRLVPAGGELNPLPPPGAIGVRYSIERREVTFVLRMNRSLATACNTVVGDGVREVGKLPVFAGPDNTAIGGKFDFKATPPPGGLVGLIDGAIPLPELEFAGKTLLTPAVVSPDPNPTVVGPGETGPTKNPRPTGDARSRGSLVRMVTAALASPSETGPATFVLPTDANRFTGG